MWIRDVSTRVCNRVNEIVKKNQIISKKKLKCKNLYTKLAL